jgi:hypothetical protein
MPIHRDHIIFVDLFAYLFHLTEHKKCWVECTSVNQGVKCEGICVMTSTLGSQPRRRHGKAHAESVI